MKLLHKYAKYIAPDIAKLINNFFSKCVFPDDLKFAEVSSLFKRNDVLNKSNYRPVIFLIALSKIYEKALSIQVAEHFNSIFSALLSAFRKGYNCQSTLLNMIENCKCVLDKGEDVACVTMDISKAFDCLPHYLTICKLHAYGFSSMRVSLLQVICIDGNKGLKLAKLKVTGKKCKKVCPKIQFWDHWLSIFSWMICFILLNKKVFLIMLMTIQCL